MRAIGIDVDLQNTDAATFQKRIWTDNVYQTASYGIFNMPDPTIGVQRMFWSKNIRKGVPYSNGSGYSSPEMDALLEAGQSEVDVAKRREIFNKMQALAMTDLPIIPIINVGLHDSLQQARQGLHGRSRGRVRHIRERNVKLIAAISDVARCPATPPPTG